MCVYVCIGVYSSIHYSHNLIRLSNEVAKLLLDAGADPNMKGMDGATPLLKAIAAKDIRTLQVFVNHPQTDINKEVRKFNTYGRLTTS